GQFGSLLRIAPGVDDQAPLGTDNQPGGEVQLVVTACEHPVGEFDPLSAARHLASTLNIVSVPHPGVFAAHVAALTSCGADTTTWAANTDMRPSPVVLDVRRVRVIIRLFQHAEELVQTVPTANREVTVPIVFLPCEATFDQLGAQDRWGKQPQP